jgi:hypothetical protein
MADRGLQFSLQDLAFAKLPPEDLKQLVERNEEDVTRPIVASACRTNELVRRRIRHNILFLGCPMFPDDWKRTLMNEGWGVDDFLYSTSFAREWSGLADELSSIAEPGSVVTPLQDIQQRSIEASTLGHSVAVETRALDEMFPHEAFDTMKTLVFPKEAEHAAEEAARVLHATVADLLALPPPTLEAFLKTNHEGHGYYDDMDFHEHALNLGMSVQERTVVWKALFGTDLPSHSRRSKRKRHDTIPDASARVQNYYRVPDAFLKGLPGDTLCSAFFDSFKIRAECSFGYPFGCRRCRVHELRGTLHTLTHDLCHVAGHIH